MRTIILLAISNVFMTFAWYGHLKNMRNKPVAIAIFASWGIALFEYAFQVPANRLGYGPFSLGQLKVIQEVITMTVFMAFAYLYMKKQITLDYFYASLCLFLAAYFIFRAH